MLQDSDTSRRGSCSMWLASRESAGIDIDFSVLNFEDAGDGNTPSVPCSPLREVYVNQAPLRERFTTGIAIIAETSPEIKALNLPSTPTFPPTRLDFGRSSSFSFSPAKISPCTRQASGNLNTAQSMRERVALCIDTMGDVKDAPSFTSPPTIEEHPTPSSSIYHGDEEDDLLRAILPEKVPHIVPYHPDENKENIHPNLINEKVEKPKLTLLESRDDDPSLVQKKSRHGRRKSFHRRISCESLPSPAEIGPSSTPLGSQTPRRRTVQFGSSVFNLSRPSLEEPGMLHEHCRTNSQPNMRMLAKNLQLSTGFR